MKLNASEFRRAHNLVGRKVRFRRTMPEQTRRMIRSRTGKATSFNGRVVTVEVNETVHNIEPQFLEEVIK